MSAATPANVFLGTGRRKTSSARVYIQRGSGNIVINGRPIEEFFGRETVSFILLLPIALPGIVTGMALNATFEATALPFSPLTIVIGHATFCVVLVYNNAIARLRRSGASLEEASSDLGADSWTTFRRVTFPQLRSALLAGALLAFALSFDEVIVTLFAAGAGTKTIPVWIYTAMQRPNELPVVNVVALVLVLLSIAPVYLAQRIGGGFLGVDAAAGKLHTPRAPAA